MRATSPRPRAAAADGSLSAQFEHTVLVTEEGVEVLTDPALLGAAARSA